MYRELSSSAQIAYAQLLEASQSGDLLRSVADLPGSFAAKTVKGHKYWYFQYTEPNGKLRQLYVGPDTDEVRALLAKKDNGSTSSEALGRLARAAEALGCEPLERKHFRVIARLAEYGFFRAGGILIGTHAFIAHGNMTGVHWEMKGRTEDLDYAHAGRSLAIALPESLELNTDQAIRSLDMGFLPIRGLSSQPETVCLNPREPEFRLDFVTPLAREAGRHQHPRLGVSPQPLKYLEYCLQDIRQAALFHGDRAVLVNVPAPARYALHKLLIHRERADRFRAKINKDLDQTASLLAVLRETSPWTVREAWRDLVARGPAWRSNFQLGVEQLDRRHPEAGFAAWFAGFEEQENS